MRVYSILKSLISLNMCKTICHDSNKNIDKKYMGWVLSLKCHNDWSALMLKKSSSNIDIFNILDHHKNLHIIKLYDNITNKEIAKIEYITVIDLDTELETCALFSPLNQDAYEQLKINNIKERIEVDDGVHIIGTYDISIEST